MIIENNQALIHLSYNNLLINFFDYVVEVTVHDPTRLGSGFLLDNGSAVRFKFHVEPYGYWVLSFLDEEDVVLTGFTDQSTSYRLQVIVKGSQFALFINANPVGYFEYAPYHLYRGDSPGVWLSVKNGEAAFSDFKAWNLRHFDVPSE